MVVKSRLEGSLPCVIEHPSHFVRLTLSPQQKESPFYRTTAEVLFFSHMHCSWRSLHLAFDGAIEATESIGRDTEPVQHLQGRPQS